MEKNPLKGRNQHELKELGKEAVGIDRLRSWQIGSEVWDKGQKGREDLHSNLASSL